MNKKKKRFLALFLALTVAAPNVVWANTQQEIDVSGLKVSDAFAAKHPHGMFEVLSPYIMTGEGKEFDFYVLRRGGTEGEASVNIKAVEISAKYGEDFVLQEKDALGFYHDLQKSADNPTVLENQVELNKDVIFTTDRLASGAAIDVYTFDETASGAAFDAAQDNDTEALNTDAGTDAGAAVLLQRQGLFRALYPAGHRLDVQIRPRQAGEHILLQGAGHQYLQGPHRQGLRAQLLYDRRLGQEAGQRRGVFHVQQGDRRARQDRLVQQLQPGQLVHRGYRVDRHLPDRV